MKILKYAFLRHFSLSCGKIFSIRSPEFLTRKHTGVPREENSREQVLLAQILKLRGDNKKLTDLAQVKYACSVSQCVAVCRSVLQYVAVYCSVLQCVAVCVCISCLNMYILVCIYIYIYI